MREIGATAILQIHHREGDFAHHVDPAHLLVELDAIEDDELAVDTRDVAQMQVAVALAHEALLRGDAGKRRGARRARARSSARRSALELVALRRP